MNISNSILFIGQAPSEAIWETACALYRFDEDRIAFADLYALMSKGSGRRMTELLGISWEEFEGCSRTNLMARFEGHHPPKGDVFDLAEAGSRAQVILADSRYSHLVLLGRLVAEAFCLEYKPLRVTERVGKAILLLPHPSPINAYYNDCENVLEATRSLRSFVALADKREPMAPKTGLSVTDSVTDKKIRSKVSVTDQCTDNVTESNKLYTKSAHTS